MITIIHTKECKRKLKKKIIIFELCACNANINRIFTWFGKKRLSSTQCVLNCTTRILRADKVYGIYSKKYDLCG